MDVVTNPDGTPLSDRQRGSYERFMARLSELGATLVEPHWLGFKEPHRVRCAAGHDCNPRPSNAMRRGVCTACGGRSKEGAEAKFRTRVSELGGKVLGPYRGAFVPVPVLCAEGHPCSPRPSNVNSGLGFCSECLKSGRRFTARIEELGGSVVGEYTRVDRPVKVVCREGHECNPAPASVLKGRGPCQKCAGQIHDAFYVVTGNDTVKFGITSGDPRPRLDNHKRDGIGTQLFLRTDLPDGHARNLEIVVMDALKRAGCTPTRGREYFPADCTGLILSLARAALPTG